MSDDWTPPVVITEDHSEASRMLELLASIRQPWFKDAARRGKPELFFPDRENGLTARVAKRICAGCSVVTDCQELALEMPHCYPGVWGGWDARERRRRAAAKRRVA